MRNARRPSCNGVSRPLHPQRFFRDARDVPPRPAIGRDLQLVQAHAASLMWGAPNFGLVGKQRSSRMRYAAPRTKRKMGRIGKLRLLTAILTFESCWMLCRKERCLLHLHTRRVSPAVRDAERWMALIRIAIYEL
jgi:hypothetical protein